MRSILFAALAGLLIGISGAPVSFSFAAFLAPAALLTALEPSIDRTVSMRRAIVIGAICGFVVDAFSMYWTVGLLIRFAHFPFVLALALAALLWLAQSLPFVLASWLSAAAMRRGAPGWLVVPAALTVAASLIPGLFPWRFGNSQIAFLPYAQLAELGGVPLIDWMAATVSCGALEAARRLRLAPAIASLAALALPIAYGVVRIDQVENERSRAPLLRVGVVQPNTSIEDKYTPKFGYAQLRELRSMTSALEAEGAELSLWPESAYPFPIARSIERDRRFPLGVLHEGVRGPVLTGVVSSDGEIGIAAARDEHGRFLDTFEVGLGSRFNSAAAFDRGHVIGIADKVRLLAFGEYVPLWDYLPPIQIYVGRGLREGRGSQVLTIRGARVGVLNCYEDLLSDYVREQSRFAPEFWANLTNNAWFGDTSAPHLHHMLARMRAIETRRDLVRAVNTGVSGHTHASGRDALRTAPFTDDAFVADVRLMRGVTPWMQLGDWPCACLAGALLGFAFSRRRASAFRFTLGQDRTA